MNYAFVMSVTCIFVVFQSSKKKGVKVLKDEPLGKFVLLRIVSVDGWIDWKGF